MPSKPKTGVKKPLASTLALATLLLALGGGAWLWNLARSGELDRWQAQAIEAQLRKYSALLPFEIEKVEVQKNWKELFSGRVSQVVLWLKRDSFRAILAGPLNVTQAPEGGFRIEYLPEATFESIGIESIGVPASRSRSEPLPLRIWIGVGRDLTLLSELGIHARAPRWKWPFLGLKLEDHSLVMTWPGGDASGYRAKVEARIKSVEWQRDENTVVNVQELSASLEAPLTLQPFSLGPKLEGAIQAQGGEALFGGLYADLPLSKLPLRFNVDLPASRAELSVGEDLTLAASLDQDEAKVKWKLRPRSLPKLLGSAQAAAPSLFETPLAGVEIKEGRLESRGELVLALPSAELREVAGSLKVSGAALRMPKALLATQGVNLKMKFSREKGAWGIASADRILFRNARASLEPVDFSLTPRRVPPRGQLLALDYAVSIGESSELPLRVEDLELSIQSLVGNLSPASPASKDEPLDFTLQSSLRLPPIPASKLLSLLCIPMRRVPPAQISVDFPRVDVGPDWIEPEGRIRAEAFGGRAEVQGIALSELGSATPELYFDAFMENIRLDQLGHWLGLGTVQGVFEGEATGVHILSWLPIHYFVRLEAKPVPGGQKVYFSPPAMKNFLKLASSDGSLDQLPGFADWFAFGFLRRLLGGYSLDYAGVILSAADGFIQVRTLDKPKILKESKEEGRHFILYGKSNSGFTGIKWPLPGPNYPLIVSAPALSDYLRQLMFRMGMLKPDSRDSSKEPTHEEQATCNPPL